MTAQSSFFRFIVWMNFFVVGFLAAVAFVIAMHQTVKAERNSSASIAIENIEYLEWPNDRYGFSG